MKKILGLSVIGLVGAASLLGACSNETGGEEQTTLEVWAMGEEGNNLPKLLEGFTEDNPDINIDVQAIPWDQSHEKLLTAVASGNGPDVLQLGTTRVPEFADAGILLPLDEYMDEYPEFAPENFFDGAVESTQFDGETIGIPWYVETRALYYRTDLLAEAGFDQAPQNWDELKSAASSLSEEDDVYGFSIDMNDPIVPVILGWQNGADFVDENGNVDVRDEAFVEGLEFYVSFFEEGISSTSGQMDTIEGFRNGVLPMFQSGPWMINLINEQAPEIEGDWDIAMLPGQDTNASVMGGSNLSIFHNSENVDESLRLISYLSQEETQLEWFDIVSALPSNVEAWEHESLSDNPFLETFGQQLTEAKASPQIQKWDSLSGELLRSLERIIVGGADFDEEISSFQDKVSDIMEEE
ncbi:sugar ABC transporter substrate-binding protein [Alteribacter keqinensis]|uniref:Extracellular solute-binding protein n=1 Tax=Alteribacter keqinensis TaxID=2483800 RepID=A0A3M7TSZ6_9BACI|nr:sugar ABC transporter substrate-binding protein [Alteribacter keqinensis]RNA68419.1 extracellular solute-binding protein [Alteribacter keqinensis]